MTKQRNIKIVLEYDGSVFFGFQRQPQYPTIHEALEKALTRLFNCKTKIKAASGRTDSGVHADYQVVNFYTAHSMSCDQIQKGLNAVLPKAIAVKETTDVPKNYHARFNVKHKTYEYKIWNHKVRSPLRAAWSYHVPEQLHLQRMRQAARCLEGRHDFRSFCSANGKPEGEQKRGTVRTLHRFVIKKRGSLITCSIQADGFLHHMVRNLVGTLLEIGKGRRDPEGLRQVLQAKDRKCAGATVPALGLSLVNVTY